MHRDNEIDVAIGGLASKVAKTKVDGGPSNRKGYSQPTRDPSPEEPRTLHPASHSEYSFYRGFEKVMNFFYLSDAVSIKLQLNLW